MTTATFTELDTQTREELRPACEVGPEKCPNPAAWVLWSVYACDGEKQADLACDACARDVRVYGAECAHCGMSVLSVSTEPLR